MIAGMSLMVAAVIHFASADIAMAELRLDEVRAQALGRGAVLMAVREMAMRETSAGSAEEDDLLAVQGETKQNGFSGSYAFGGDWKVQVQMAPAAGLISLNNAVREDLRLLFSRVGLASPSAAGQLTDGIVSYRENFPGFRYPEEMLAVQGASRDVYDRVKAFVHPYRTGAFSANGAPTELKALFDQDSDRTAMPVQTDAAAGQATRGLVTFASIAEEKRNPEGSTDQAVKVATIRIKLPHATQLQQRLWVSLNSADPVLRAEQVHRQIGQRDEQ
jgi:hypothetical protein